METNETTSFEKLITNYGYEFTVSFELKMKNLIICVFVVNGMVEKFRKERSNSIMLKKIANIIAYSQNKNFRLKLNPYDSGTEWKGQYELMR